MEYLRTLKNKLNGTMKSLKNIYKYNLVGCARDYNLHYIKKGLINLFYPKWHILKRFSEYLLEVDYRKGYEKNYKTYFKYSNEVYRIKTNELKKIFDIEFLKHYFMDENKKYFNKISGLELKPDDDIIDKGEIGYMRPHHREYTSDRMRYRLNIAMYRYGLETLKNMK